MLDVGIACQVASKLVQSVEVGETGRRGRRAAELKRIGEASTRSAVVEAVFDAVASPGDGRRADGERNPLTRTLSRDRSLQARCTRLLGSWTTHTVEQTLLRHAQSSKTGQRSVIDPPGLHQFSTRRRSGNGERGYAGRRRRSRAIDGGRGGAARAFRSVQWSLTAAPRLTIFTQSTLLRPPPL